MKLNISVFALTSWTLTELQAGSRNYMLIIIIIIIIIIIDRLIGLVVRMSNY